MLIQLCYASRRVEYQNDLLQDLSDILAKARAFNEKHQIYGVLYYAEGKYFQCLEGEKEQLDMLFSRIQQDSRHTQIIRFEDQPIEEIHFSRWSMKYVNQHGKIQRFFEKNEMQSFLPHQLDQNTLKEFLHLLLKMDEADTKPTLKKGLHHRGYQDFF